MQVKTTIKEFKTDMFTPVGLYLKIRNRFRKPMLLEGNDYHSRSDSSSIIGFDPLVEIIVGLNAVKILDNGNERVIPLTSSDDVNTILDQVIQEYRSVEGQNTVGFFSYFGFEFSHLSEPQVRKNSDEQKLPLAHLILYKYILILDHFHDTGKFISNSAINDNSSSLSLDEILSFPSNSTLPFELRGQEMSNISDENFLEYVYKAKQHILRGDVFQLVLSREFSTNYFGDDFQLYRELRTLNPSPYLFYADFETHRIIGSSPEKQLQIKKGIAEIHPIAGTVRKTGNEEADNEAVQGLILDIKENAEHTMLVDLARNDLSKYAREVKITKYKEVQYFSHVIHLVSKVIGSIEEHNALDVFNGTFPAGTLSGTPKPKALELIEKYEPRKRDYYGGAIGFIGFDGNINLAIIIRSVLSMNNQLFYRAGAGIVLDSDPKSELDEVNNKLGAVRKAIHAATAKNIDKAIAI